MTDDAPELLTLSEAAALTGTSRSTIRRYLDDGRFPNAAQDDDGRAAWRVPVADLEAAGLDVDDPGREQVGTEVAGTGEQDRTEVTTEVAEQVAPSTPGTALVPISELGDLFQRIANAETRAVKAETELAHVRERLVEARTEAEEPRIPAAVWAVLVVLVVAVAVAGTVAAIG